MNPPTLLTLGTRTNAALSLLTGALLTVAPGQVSDRLGLEIGGWLRALGIALLAHAALLEWIARRKQPAPWVRLNLAVIVPYPFALLVIAASSIVEPAGGKMLLVTDALCVAIVAGIQRRGLHQNRLIDATLPA